MVKKNYSPERGDIVGLKGKALAVVISPKEYNEKTGLGLFCPITEKVKDYPFEVKITSEKINGAVLTDQIKSLNWKAQEIEFVSKIPPETIDEIMSKIGVLLEIV
jgi:mRNA interferase MazF